MAGMARRPISLQDLLAAMTAVSVTFGAATAVGAVHGGDPAWFRAVAAILLTILMPYSVFTAVFCLTHGWLDAWWLALKVVVVAVAFVILINVWGWLMSAIGGR
jgi:hypothetical protein